MNANSPVTLIEPDKNSPGPQAGIALCLSGGGYRAMLFHVGVVWRLNQLGVLRRLNRVSSVSGGSITAALLGLHWRLLTWDAKGIATNLVNEFVAPIRSLASKTIDAESIILGLLTPGSISDRIMSAYEEFLFSDATLQALPSDTEGPRFVINATNIQSGALWRFSKPFMADYLVGRVEWPKVRLSKAVACSSAFPPVLSPATLKLKQSDFVPDPGCPLQKEPFTTDVVLSDGGVYDNLGLETAWKRYSTVLVSDGGGKLAPEGEPKRDWAQHSYRVLNVIDNQVRSLRKRQIIEAFKAKDGSHNGAYWGIRTHIQDYGLASALPCPHEKVLELANIPTRLKRIEPEYQERLINWGFAVSDAALRRHCAEVLAIDPNAPVQFPYERGV